MKNLSLKRTGFALFSFLFFLKSSPAQVLLKSLDVTGEAIEYKGKLFFSADDRANGPELWITDGTQGGTKLLKDIWPGEKGSHPSRFVLHGGWMYFNASDGRHGMEVWRTDGTEEGTELFQDHKTGPDNFFVNSWIHHDGRLLFTEGYWDNNLFELHPDKRNISCIHPSCPMLGGPMFSIQKKLYRNGYSGLDWLNEKTGVLEQIPIPGFAEIQNMYVANEKIYLVDGREYGNEKKLGMYDPATGKTTTLQSWTTDTYGSVEVGEMLQVGDLLFFSVRLNYDYGEDQDQLWISKGTPEETKMLKSFKWDYHYSASEMLNFTQVNGKLFFAGNYSVGGGIWTSDGTTEGTLKVLDFSIQKKNSYFDQNNPLSSWNDKLYFESAHLRSFSILDPGKGNDHYVYGERMEGLRFLGGAGTHFYFADQQGIWSDQEKPRVQELWSSINFPSIKKDSCTSQILPLRNIGRETLYFSEVSITGKSFFVQEGFPASLAPGASADLKVIFFPGEGGRHEGKLTILTNDRTEPILNIPVRGASTKEKGRCKEEIYPQKRILYNLNNQSIQLSKTSIEENNGLDFPVGIFSVPEREGEYSYSLVAGEGDLDNAFFSVQGNQLIARHSFNFVLANFLSIRVKAEGAEVFENPVFIRVQDLQETEEKVSCNEWLLSMDHALQDVTFLNEQKVMAVGDGGIILKSEDAGSTWKDISPRIWDNFHKIVFPVADTGFVMGDRRILKTTNAGKDWLVLQLPDYDGQLVGLSFSNTKTGNFVTSYGEVFRTKSGGDHWEFVQQFQGKVSASFFLDSLNGWVGTENSLLHFTNDGGYSWRTLAVNGITSLGIIQHIQAFDTLNVFILTAEGDLFRTENGGINWKGLGSEISRKTSIRMFSKLEGYLFQENMGVYKTTDGGLQWTQVFTTPGKGWSIAYNSTGNQIVVVGQSEGYNYLYKPHKLILTGSNNEWKTRSFLKMDYLFYPQWLENGAGVAMAENYHYNPSFYRTQDGGLTWQPFPIPTIQHSARGFSFFNLEVGIITTYGHLLRTSDGGKNWESISNQWGLRNIQFVSENVLYGENLEWMLKSTDGGFHWDTLNISISGTGSGIDFRFINEQMGFAWGGELFRTIDGGNSWESVHNGQYMLVSSIQFLNEQTGFIKLFESEILKTADGGKTWQVILQENHQEPSLYPFFYDDKKAFASSRSNIYRSEDGGKNWKQKFNTDGRRMVINRNGLNEVIGYSRGDGSFDNGSVLFKISENITPTIPGNISGERAAVPGNPYSYKAAKLEHIGYSWSVIGGKILRYEENEILVQWEKGQEKEITLDLNDGCGLQRQLSLLVEERDLNSIGEEEEEEEEEKDPVTAVKDQKGKGTTILYPNPTTGQVYLKSEQLLFQEVKMEVRNLFGQLVLVKEIKSVQDHQPVLDLSSLEEGLYLVHFINKDSVKSIKIWKK